MEICDLHMHTTASDGTLSPREVVEYAAKIGLTTIAITDHYSLEGLEEAIAVGNELGVYVITGVEINSYLEDREYHILGFFSRTDLSQLRAIRDAFNTQFAGQIALVLKRRRGLREVDPSVTPAFAVQFIRDQGGLPIVAHPGRYQDNDKLTLELVQDGVGVEAYYYTYSPEVTNHYLKMAEKYGVIVTGGGDCHGPGINGNGLYKIGKVDVPLEIGLGLKEVLGEARIKNRKLTG